MTLPRFLVLIVLSLSLVWVVVFAVSGGLGGGPADAVDRASDKAVCDAALIALARGELRKLRPLMTDAGWSQFEREMHLLRVQLAKAEPDPAIQPLLDIARETLGAGTDAELRAVQRGDAARTWAFLLKLYPMEDPPRMAGIEIHPDRPNQRTWFYWGSAGKPRSVSLLRRRGTWYVDAIGLL